MELVIRVRFQMDRPVYLYTVYLYMKLFCRRRTISACRSHPARQYLAPADGGAVWCSQRDSIPSFPFARPSTTGLKAANNINHAVQSIHFKGKCTGGKKTYRFTCFLYLSLEKIAIMRSSSLLPFTG